MAVFKASTKIFGHQNFTWISHRLTGLFCMEFHELLFYLYCCSTCTVLFKLYYITTSTKLLIGSQNISKTYSAEQHLFHVLRSTVLRYPYSNVSDNVREFISRPSIRTGCSLLVQMILPDEKGGPSSDGLPFRHTKKTA